MKDLCIALGLLMGMGLLAACESGTAVRSRERSAVYATLQPWQKRSVDHGIVEPGFTPDMVYIALGRPAQVLKKEAEEGQFELWTYDRYYPNEDALRRMRVEKFDPETASEMTQTQLAANGKSGTGWMRESGGEVNSMYPTRGQVPLGMAAGGIRPSIAKTGPAQGGSMEPPDLPSYTVQILFHNGEVRRIGATANTN